MRGVARIDQGTGGGSPLAADNAPIFDAYAQTAAYIQSQWFGSERQPTLRRPARRTRRRRGRRVLTVARRDSSAITLRCNSKSMPQPRFARRSPRSFTIPDSRIRISRRSARASAMRRSSRRRSGEAFRFGWFTTSGSNLIVSPPPLYIPENVGHASIAGLSLALRRPRYGDTPPRSTSRISTARKTSTPIAACRDVDRSLR